MKSDKDVFSKDILVGLGRFLRIPQGIALQQCRNEMELIHQMWEDGFSSEDTLKIVMEKVKKNMATDEDLKWYVEQVA